VEFRSHPQFAAPWDQARAELRFCQLVAGFPEVSGYRPRLLAGDPEARVLVLEDLGDGRSPAARRRRA